MTHKHKKKDAGFGFVKKIPFCHKRYDSQKDA